MYSHMLKHITNLSFSEVSEMMVEILDFWLYSENDNTLGYSYGIGGSWEYS